MRTTITNVLTKLAILTAILSVALAASYLYAEWNPAPASPPNNNVDTPLNTGIDDQIKSAGLSLLKLIVNGPVQIQDGTEGAGKVLTSDASGVASWETPTPGSGISQLDQGTGIILTPNPITDTGTISVDTSSLQSRVSGDCNSDQAIRKINSDGSVECVNKPPSAICTYNGADYSTGATCQLGYSPYRCSTPTGYIYRMRVQSCQSDGTWNGWVAGCRSTYPDCAE